MRCIIGGISYPTIEGSSVSITRAMGDPVPTCTVNLVDNTSSLFPQKMQEILVLDDQVIPNPTTNLLLNPSLNPYTNLWGPPGASGPVGLTQIGGGGVQMQFVSATTGNFGNINQSGQPAVVGQSYMLSLSLQGTATPANIEAIIQIQWSDDNSVPISTSQLIVSTVPTSVTRYTVSGVAPANTAFAEANITCRATGSATGTIAITQPQFEPMWFSALSYPTPWCGPLQTNCQQLPLGLWIRQYRKFAGFVNHVVNQDYVGNKRTVVVNAVGYAWLASTITGNDTFASKTDAQVFTSLLAKYFVTSANPPNLNLANLPLCTTTNIVTGVSVSNLQLNWDDLRTVFDNLASLSGFYWTIDYYWNFVYAPPGYFSMQIGLICDNSSITDMVTTFPAYNFSAETDFTQPGSNIIVIGGTSGATTFTAQVIDPSMVAQLGRASGYVLPSTTSWMRKVTDSALGSNADCTQRGMGELLQYDHERGIYHLTTNVEIIAGYGVAITSVTEGLMQSTQLIQQVTATWIGTSETLTDTWEYAANLGAANRAATNMISRIFRNTIKNTSAPAISSVTLAALEKVNIVDSLPTSPYIQTALADSPIRLYTLGEPAGFNITTAYDWTGNQSGAYTGGFTLGQGGLLSTDGTSVLLDGTSGYVNLPMTGLPTGASPWTVECWLKTSTTSPFQVVFALGNSGAGAGVSLQIRSGGNIAVGDGSTHFITGAVLIINTTYYVAITYDGISTVTFYLYNASGLTGVYTATHVFNLNYNGVGTNIAYIGQDWYSDFYTGNQQMFAIYPAALSQTRITAHYNIGKFGHS